MTDDYFVFMLETVWGVKEAGKSDEKNTTVDPKIPNLVKIIKESLRAKCKVEDTERKVLANKFQLADLSNSGFVNASVWRMAIGQITNQEDAELDLLFGYYAEGQDRVQYSKVIESLFPARLYSH